MKKNLKKIISVLTAIAVVGAANYFPQSENFSIQNLISVSAQSSYGVLNYKIVDDEVTITGLNDLNAKEIEIPSEIEGYSVTSICDYSFWGCSSLTSITIPNSVTSIGDCAFGGCSSLTSITIPNSVTSIGEWSFYECNALKSVIIPKSVDYIGFKALGYDAWGKIEDFKIYGYINSKAEIYAAENGIDFLVLDEGIQIENIYDVDGNGDVSMSDLVSLKKQILGYETEYSQTADINKDGKVNSLDLVALIKYLLEN